MSIFSDNKSGYALADAPRPHEDLRAPRTTGKLLLDPSDWGAQAVP